MPFPILQNGVRSGGYQRETLNKKKIRIGLAVALTALLFTMYYLILDYFETPAWIPMLVFVFLLCLLSAARRRPAGYFIPAQKRRGINRRTEKIRALYHRAEEFFYLRLTGTISFCAGFCFPCSIFPRGWPCFPEPSVMMHPFRLPNFSEMQTHI